ncbi:MAG: hypothetical protein PVF43_14835, partial [Candidatus Eiseniibacteriota bacterium]
MAPCRPVVADDGAAARPLVVRPVVSTPGPERDAGHELGLVTEGAPHAVDGTPLVDSMVPRILARLGTRGLTGAPPVRGASTTAFFTIDLATQQFITVQATLRGESAHTLVYVEDAEWGDRVDQAAVDAVLAAFDTETPAGSLDPGRGISEIVEQVYGPPTDIDQDGKVHILVLDIRDAFMGTGAYVAGYYTSHDQTSGYGSNRRDLLYIDCNPANAAGEAVLGTVAHEYQHLVHYAADPDEGSSTPFMNEALSELSSFLCGYGLRTPSGFTTDADVSLDAWSNIEADYGRVALWSLYLYEQLGLGAVHAIFAEPANGVTGIELGLATAGDGRDLATLMADWFVANAVNAPAGDPRYGYRAWSGTVDPSATHSAFPASAQASVEHRAADVVRLRGLDPTLVVDPVEGVGLRARAVVLTPAGELAAVEELSLGTLWRATDVVADAEEALLVAFTTGVFGAVYAYEAGALSANIEEIAYDDGTAEMIGLLPPAAWDRGVAVRFTFDGGEATPRGLRFLSGLPAAFEVQVWDASGPAGGPGEALISPIPVQTPSGQSWVEVDLRSAGLEATSDSRFAGLVLPGGSTDTLAIGLDVEAPYAGNSWLLEAGSWSAFDDVGLADADLMLRLEVQYPDGPPPEFAIGLLHEPSLSERVDIYVVAAEAINASSLGGVVEHDGQSEALTFTAVDGLGTVFVADGVTLVGSGSGRVIVSGTAARGVTAASDTLRFEATWVGGAGGLLALDGAELELPSGALTASALLSAQPGSDFPGGATMGSGTTSIAASVTTFGPGDVELREPAIVRLPAGDGVIARWTGQGWQGLATRAAATRLEASTLRLGTFAVVDPAAAAPPPVLRLSSLGALPAIEGT